MTTITHDAGDSGATTADPARSAARTASLLNLTRGMSDADLAVLEDLGAWQLVAKGDHLVVKGQEGDALFGVILGSIVVKSDDGRLVSVMGAGDTFGEIAFLTGGCRTADVLAQSDAQLLRLPGDAVRALADTHPAIAARLYANLAREMATRLAATTEMALL